MKNFARYLSYRLETSAMRTLLLTVISLLISLYTVADCTNKDEIRYNQTGIYVLAIVLGAVCTLIPMLETAGFKNRRNLDTLYFFPIKRVKMALAHFLSGFVQVTLIYSITFFAVYAYLAAKTDYFALGYMFFYYILSLLLGLIMYSIFIFLFGQANTVADGVVFCIIWIFALCLIIFTLRTEVLGAIVTDKKSAIWQSTVDLPSWGIIYAPINNLTVIFQDLIEVNRKALQYTSTSAYAQRYIDTMYMFFVWGALGLASAVGYFITFVKKGAQRAGEISDSFFGYRTLIPVCGYCLLLFFGSMEGVMLALVFAAMIAGYAMYRRSFRLKASDLIITGCGILALLLGSIF